MKVAPAYQHDKTETNKGQEEGGEAKDNKEVDRKKSRGKA